MKVLISAGIKSDGLYKILNQKFLDGSIEFYKEDYIENLSGYLNRGGTADRILVLQDSLNKDGNYNANEIYKVITGLSALLDGTLHRTEVVFVTDNGDLADILYSETYSFGERRRVLLLEKGTRFDVAFFKEISLEAINNFENNIKLGSNVYRIKGIDYSSQQSQYAEGNNFVETELVGELDDIESYEFSDGFDEGDEDDGGWEDDTEWEEVYDDELDDTDETSETNSELTDVVDDNFQESVDDFTNSEVTDEIEETSGINSDITDEVDDFQESVDDFTNLESTDEIEESLSDTTEVESTQDDLFKDDSFEGDTFETDGLDDSLSEADELFLDDLSEQDTSNDDIESTVDDEISDSDDLFNTSEDFTDTDSADSLFEDDTDNKDLEAVEDDVSLESDTVLEDAPNIETESIDKKKGKSWFGRKKQSSNASVNKSSEDFGYYSIDKGRLILNYSKDYTELYKVLDSYNRRGHLLLVTGVSNSGKTTIAGNIASLLANLGHSVALVDFDLNKRGQTYLCKDAYDAVRYDDNYSKVLMRAINSKSTNIAAQGAIVREGLNLFGTSIIEDTPNIDTVVPSESSVRDFIYNLKSVYNFIVVDCPLVYIGSKLVELVIGADSIVVTTENTNKSLLEFTMELSNIDDYKVRRDIFSRAKVVVNRTSSDSGVALGYKYKNYTEMLAILDRHILDSTGYETGGIFSGMKVLGNLPDVKELDNLILSKRYFSDSKLGKEIYLELLHSLFVE